MASRATTVGRASWLNNFNNNSHFNANDRNVNNHNRLRGIAQSAETLFFMAAYRDLWQEVCSFSNLELAFQRARKHKTLKPYVVEFEADLASNLTLLRTELLLHSYKPQPLETFILRDPKTRKISKSDFRDRVIHHALCNIIEPLFEKCFIYDSYANRVRKGTLKALERFEHFKRKVTKNLTCCAFVLKADIRHYFDEVDHAILLRILNKKIKDPRIIWLVKRILSNYSTQESQGMPLGNLTSQFFANVYLNELDLFVKHKLKAKYYIRYVDDFVILHLSKKILERYKTKINMFLQQQLELKLHPEKSRIISLHQGTDFLGMRIFLYHKLVREKNICRFYRELLRIFLAYAGKMINYDAIYNFIEGWVAHAKNAHTYKLRQRILLQTAQEFPGEISSKEVDRMIKNTRNEVMISRVKTS